MTETCLFYQIHKFLDQHVIGQQKCKKYLATQVYQHARKIQKIMSEQQQKTAQVETDVKMKDFELQFRGIVHKFAYVSKENSFCLYFR